MPNHLYLIFKQNNKVFIFIKRATEKFVISRRLIAPISASSSHSFLRKRSKCGSITRGVLIYCASAVRQPPSRAQAYLTADPAHCQSGTRPSAQARNISVSLPFAPHPSPPLFPLQEAGSGARSPREEAEGRNREALSLLPEDHVPAQQGGGPASRPLPPRLPGSPPGESRVEKERRRGGGERPSSGPAHGAERAPPFRAGAVTSYRLFIPVPGGPRRGPWSREPRKRRGQLWRARDVVSPGFGVGRRD